MKNLIIFTCTIFTTILYSQEDFIQSSYQDLFINTFSVADYNGDGYSDVFGVDLKFAGLSDIYILLNNADGTIGFEETLLEEGYGAIGRPAAGDYDGDGDMDIVLAKGDDADLYVLKNDGTANFESIALGVSGAIRFQFQDLEGDGDLDIVGVDTDNNTLTVFINDGSQNYSAVNLFTGSTDLYAYDSGDIDGDGDVDVVIGFSEYNGNQIVAYRNNGDNTFEEVVIMANDFDNLQGIAIADINDDGQNDIAAIHRFKYSGWINQGNFSFEMEDLANYPSGSSGFISLLMGDYNGDGVPDPVMGSDDGIVWHTNVSTDPMLYEEREVGGVAPAYNLANGDFDLDGDMDLIVSNGDFWWYENNIVQVATESIPKQPFQLSLFPNPAGETIRINTQSSSNIKITSFMITDEQGRMFLNGGNPDGEQVIEINIKKLVPGYYIFNGVTSSAESVNMGFVKN